jgi:hypothetical protein
MRSVPIVYDIKMQKPVHGPDPAQQYFQTRSKNILRFQQIKLELCVFCASESKTNEQDGVAVTMQTPVWEMLGSNPGQDTAYPDGDVSYISSRPPGKCWESTLIGP